MKDSRNILTNAFHPVIGAIIMTIAVATTASSAPANASSPEAKPSAQVRTRDLYPLITTPAVFDARDFYTRHFGFEVVFEASWFVYLSGPSDGETRGATLAFMLPEHPSNPPGPEAFSGQGMILTIEVADAAQVFEKLRAEGAPIVHPLTEEDWGQKRFMTRDPSGTLVDIIEQIAPKEGFWERYPAPPRQ